MMVGVEGSGVLSAEIVPPSDHDQTEWTLVQRFHSPEKIDSWRVSEPRLKLLEELAPKLERKEISLSEGVERTYGTVGSVAVAVVTQVKPGQEAAYCKCEGAYQSAQAKCSGYRGVYVQPPTSGTPGMWTTIIRFDSPEALDQWFTSSERKKLLEQSNPVVSSTDYQMVDTSFPGWFPSKQGAKGPPNWKTALLILLGLYPIVMLEIRFLNPQLNGLSPAFANFIGNIISVSLTTWVTMPAAIKAFDSWLFPTDKTPKWSGPAAIIVLICLFLIEIALLWRLL
jgi:antibiotic biosynthesis monooxygenase (ABM) superfamily enzyme